MNTIQTKRDVSFEIQHAVKTLGVSYRQIAEAANVGASTISRAARAGYKVNRSTHLAIVGAINHKLTPPHGVRCIAQPVDADDVSFAQGHEISTEQLAQGLQDQVNAMRETIGSVLVDDHLESARSREKAELQKALAARVEEVTSLENDLKAIEKIHDRTANELQAVRKKNATQYESIGQCFAEIHRLQDNLRDAQNCIASQEIEIDHFKGLVAVRIQDLAVYQKALEEADTLAEREGDRCQKMTVHVVELSNKLSVQRAWTWFFVLLAFVATVVGVVK